MRAERWLHPLRFGALLLLATAALSAWWGGHHVPNPDEGAVLTNAVKILHGGVFYRDIDAYPYPASNYTAALAMAVFGEDLAVARALAAGLFCMVVLSLYAAAVPLLGRPRAAVFGVSLLAFKLFGFPMFTTYTYADFALGWACLAVPLLLCERPEGRAARLAGAGACVALAFASKQNLGVYLAGAALAQLALPRFFERRDAGAAPREIAAFAGGFAAVVLPMFAWFGLQGVLPAMLHSGFVRPFTGYLPLSGIPAVPMLEWWDLGSLHGDESAAIYLPLLPQHLLRRDAFPLDGLYGLAWPLLEVGARAVYTSLPLVFGVALWRWLRSGSGGARPGEPARFALAQLAFAFVLSAFPRADWAHVVDVYPVVWLLVCASWSPGRRAARVEALAIGSVVAASLVLTVSMHSRMSYALRLERGSVWVEPEDAWLEPVIRTIRRRIPEGEPFFVYGHEAHIYFLADRYNSWRFAQLYPGQGGRGGGEEVVAMLREAPPRLVYRGVNGWPGSPPIRRYLPVLDAYVRRSFRPLPRFFERHPPPVGGPPLPLVVEMLGARRQPEAGSGRPAPPSGSASPSGAPGP